MSDSTLIATNLVLLISMSICIVSLLIFTFRLSPVALIVFVVMAPITYYLGSTRNDAVVDRAIATLEPIPSRVLTSANPHATAALMGPVEGGSAMGCFKSDSSFLQGWIPANFTIHKDRSISITPRTDIANGGMSDDDVHYDGRNKTIVEACKAAEDGAYQWRVFSR